MKLSKWIINNLKSPEDCWLVHDGRPGHANQARALVEYLNISYTTKVFYSSFPIFFSYVNLVYGKIKKLFISQNNIPKIIIACGHRTIPLVMKMQSLSSNDIRSIYIQDPRRLYSLFTAIIAPRHDDIKGKNVYSTDTSLHGIKPEKLSTIKEEFLKQVNISGKVLTVLLGGPTSKISFSPSLCQKIIDDVYTASKQTENLLISFSRRTPKYLKDTLLRFYKGKQNVWFDRDFKNNPYQGFLACADYIMVTDDSMSMVSESCGTNVPVYVIPCIKDLRKKTSIFLSHLIQKNRLRIFTGILEKWNVSPLQEIPQIIDFINKKIN